MAGCEQAGAVKDGRAEMGILDCDEEQRMDFLAARGWISGVHSCRRRGRVEGSKAQGVARGMTPEQSKLG